MKQALLLIILVAFLISCTKVVEQPMNITSNSTNVSGNVTQTVNVPAINSTINVTPQLNGTIKPNSSALPTNSSTGNPNSGTTSSSKPKTIRETLEVNAEVLASFNEWYKCKGACRIDCAALKLDFFHEDLTEESNVCSCKCNDIKAFNIPEFREIEIKVIQSNENSQVIEYIDNR